jgi:hypothetical protein
MIHMAFHLLELVSYQLNGVPMELNDSLNRLEQIWVRQTSYNPFGVMMERTEGE